MKINKKIKIIEFKLSKILNWWLFWAYKSNFSGNWMEFSEHREYIFWDHVKDIDWKASNKTNQMYVKKYEEERDLNVLFVLDNSESMKFWSQDKTKKWLLEEVFYSLSLSAYYNNDNIWWIIYDWKDFNFISNKKSKNNIYKILNLLEINNKLILDTYNTNKANNILKDLVKKWIKNNLIFILTDNIFNIDEKLLRLVSNKNELIFINIFDYFENNLTKLWWNISLNLWSRYLNIDLNNKNKVNKYVKIREKEIREIKLIFEKNKVWYINLDTKSDIFKELIWYFSKVNK